MHIKQGECWNCGDENIAGKVGDNQYPLCNKCFNKVIKGEITLEDLSRILEERRYNEG